MVTASCIHSFSTMSESKYDVVIVGAGPVGLACAIACKNRDLDVLILEKGAVVESIRRFPIHMTWFSITEMLEIGNVPFINTQMRPTREDTLAYYNHLVEHFDLHIQRYTTVDVVDGEDGNFTVHTNKGNVRAKKVVIATGYFDHPNRLPIPGVDLPHVSHYFDDPYRYAGMNTVVVGGANSAADTALSLFRHAAKVTLIHRGEDFASHVKYWVKPDLENRIKEGSINAYLGHEITEITQEHVKCTSLKGGVEQTIPADFVFLMTGYRPDDALLRRCGIELEEGSMKARCNEETRESNVPGLYLAGSAANGLDTGQIFIENARLQTEPLATDLAAKLN